MRPSGSAVATVLGIDWSGGSDAGRRIWVAHGSRPGKRLRIDWVRRCDELTGAQPRREQALPALRRWLEARDAAVVGLDFPFGLPAALVEEPDWPSFVTRFPERHPTAEAFRDDCRARADDRELKRVTDTITKTPFCAYNLRIYRQTYWGITALLAPLVATGAAICPPMQAAGEAALWLLETCPASLLKRRGLYWPYKGREATRRRGRERIVEALLADGSLALGSGVRARALADPGGDALDAVLAALAVSDALARPGFPRSEWRPEYALEAMVYA